MIEVSPYKNKKVVVYGLGISGKATMRSLIAGGTGVLAWDDNETTRDKLLHSEDVEDIIIKESISLTPPETYNWDEIAAVVLSPGIPLHHPTPHPIAVAAKKANTPIICDIELLSITTPKTHSVVITGTNGKSTTTALLGHIYKHGHKRVQVGGNIGTAVLDLDPLSHDGTYILEVSSYQIDLFQHAQFDCGILLNITPDHLERHGGMEGYVAAKQALFNHIKKDGAAIIGVDDDYCKEIYAQLCAEDTIPTVIPISCQQIVDNGIALIDGILTDNIHKESHEIGSLSNLIGTHNQQNIAAAYAAGHIADIDATSIIEAVKSFHGLEHRLQPVENINGISFINDSKATNVEAAEKAIRSFSNIYWIAGGQAKGENFDQLEPFFGHIQHVFLIGDAEEKFATMLQDKLPFTKCGKLQKAIDSAFVMAQGSFDEKHPPIILFSPACASFDQWSNFEERGKAFCEYVKQVGK